MPRDWLLHTPQQKLHEHKQHVQLANADAACWPVVKQHPLCLPTCALLAIICSYRVATSLLATLTAGSAAARALLHSAVSRAAIAACGGRREVCRPGRGRERRRRCAGGGSSNAARLARARGSLTTRQPPITLPVPSAVPWLAPGRWADSVRAPAAPTRLLGRCKERGSSPSPRRGAGFAAGLPDLQGRGGRRALAAVWLAMDNRAGDSAGHGPIAAREARAVLHEDAMQTLPALAACQTGR